jgi:KipI family sensor histidine kinase inhibitor
MPAIAPHAGLHVQLYGDSAVLITVPAAEADEAWSRLHTLADALISADLQGIEGVVATYDSLLVEFDPQTISHDELDAHLRGNAVSTSTQSGGRTHRVPALYGGDNNGPDLEDVAAQLDLTAAQFVEAHSNTLWRVAFRGAPAGSPMLDGSPFDRPIARCAHPRLRVPAGSIAVSGFQGVIYAITSPGGWRLVARTPFDVIDINRTPHLLYQPGDRFRFVPVSETEAQTMCGTLLGSRDD